MKSLLDFLLPFTRRYKATLSLSVAFNFLTAFLTVFSFAFLVPILQLLFGLDTAHYDFMPWQSAGIREVAVNNFHYFTQQLIASHGKSFTLAFLAAVMVVATLLKVGTFYLSDFFIIPLRNGIVRDMRNDMYAKILSLPIGFFTLERKGDIMARISGDVSEVENSVLSGIMGLIRYPVMILVCIAVMVYLSWQLTLFVFLLLPVVGFVMGGVGKRLKATSLHSQNLWGSILSACEETLGGLRIIKAFNAENQATQRFQALTGEFLDVNNAVQRRISLAHPMSELLGTIAIAVVLWFGGSLILSGHSPLDAAQFIYYLVIFYSIINPAKDLAKTGYNVQKGMAAMLRINQIMDAENPIKDPQSPVSNSQSPVSNSQSPVSNSIEFRNVSFAYPDDPSATPVLCGINLTVPRGKTVAIVGQSGSGKSTLADLVPRFHDATSGSVLVDGHDVKDMRLKDLRGLMGIVTQDAILFNDTVYNNIAFGTPGATPEQVEQAARIANAHGFIMETPDGYQTLVGDRGTRLSGGQRQRISIARAILKNPSVLILDEATSALDTESERLVQEAIGRLTANRTTLVIAHRLSTVTDADLIVVLHQGRIVEQGTHHELMALGGHYHRLATLQQT